MMSKRTLILFILLLLAAALGCRLGETSKPTVVINSPASGSKVQVGKEVAIQSTATDKKGIARIELWVDDNLVDTALNPDPEGQTSYSVVQYWAPTIAGSHVITVKAYNVDEVASDPATITVIAEGKGERAKPPPGGARKPTPRPRPSKATPAPPATLPPKATLAPPATLPPRPEIALDADKKNLAPGECTYLRVHIVNVQEAYLSGGSFSNLGITGPDWSREICPTATTTYILHIILPDGSTTDRQITVRVLSPVSTPTPAPHITALHPVSGESGSVNHSGIVKSGIMQAGEDTGEVGIRAYMSFDISSLAGKNVTEAKLIISGSITGTPFADLDGLWVGEVEYGAHSLQPGDYNLASSPFDRFYSIPGAIDVTSAVQSRVSAGDSRFQVRLHFALESDSDGHLDYFKATQAKLLVTYTD